MEIDYEKLKKPKMKKKSYSVYLKEELVTEVKKICDGQELSAIIDRIFLQITQSLNSKSVQKTHSEECNG